MTLPPLFPSSIVGALNQLTNFNYFPELVGFCIGFCLQQFLFFIIFLARLFGRLNFNIYYCYCNHHYHCVFIGYVYLNMGVHVSRHVWRVRGRLTGIGLLLPPRVLKTEVFRLAEQAPHPIRFSVCLSIFLPEEAVHLLTPSGVNAWGSPSFTGRT